MKKKRIAIIGANEAIAILIEKAKSLGYETHVFARQCGDPGELSADFFYPIDISKREEILNKCKRIGVCGVCSITSDFAAPVASYVARELGLTCNPPETEILARNKYEMRKALKKAGLFAHNFLKADETIDIDALKDLTYPLIVKPTDAWSSKGITRVNNVAEVVKAIKYACSFSSERKAIIEEFIDGPEYSAECICFHGIYHVLAFTKKETTGFPHYIETGHIQPSDISKNKQDEIKKFISKALSALRIENGAAHAEFRITDKGEIAIMEIGARMGGDNIGTFLTPYSTGMDYVKMVIDIACGIAPDFSIVSKPRLIKTKFIMNKNDLDDYFAFVSDNPSSLIKKSKFDNDFSREITNSSDRHGYYIYEVIEK